MFVISKKSLHRAALTISMSCAFVSASAFASEWIDAGPAIEGGAKIQLNKNFHKKSGKFKAMPESMLDQKDSIEGDFVVGAYRYVYSAPKQENGHVIDEMISTEIMDCANKYYGTLQQTKKYKGKIVADRVTADKDVLMMETRSDNNDSQLCELHAGAKPAPADRRAVTNPDYRPKVSDQDVDALLDKYAPQGSKK
jgi:hypothetical protein